MFVGGYKGVSVLMSPSDLSYRFYAGVCHNFVGHGWETTARLNAKKANEKLHKNSRLKPAQGFGNTTSTLQFGYFLWEI